MTRRSILKGGVALTAAASVGITRRPLSEKTAFEAATKDYAYVRGLSA